MPKPSPKKSARKPRASKPAKQSAAPAVAEQPSAEVEKVTLGLAVGERERVSVDLVQSLLSEGLTARVEALRGKTALELQERMRETDGRCAPVYFTAETPDGPFHLFDGVEQIAAALDIGVKHLTVVTVATEDAAALQTYLVGRRREDAAKLSDEDDFYLRVLAHYED